MKQNIATGKANGFASPAQGYEDNGIDLNTLLVRQPASTYFFRMDSVDMAELGLPRGALLVVDRSRKPLINNFVIIRYEGKFLCRMMIQENGYTIFTNGASDIMPVIDDTEVIGVVTASIQDLCQPSAESGCV